MARAALFTCLLAPPSAPAAGSVASADVTLPYPPHIRPSRALRYRTLGVDANQSLRQAARGVISMGTAIGEGYLVPGTPASDEPICERGCAQGPGCTDAADSTALCGCAVDGGTVALACAAGGVITAVPFASVGNPAGRCGNLSRGSCDGDPAKAAAYVRDTCVGRSRCTLDADINTFNAGADPCVGVVKHVEVEVTCSTGQPPPPPPVLPEQAPSGVNPYPSNALPQWRKGTHTAERYRRVAVREYEMVSPENACKFDATEPHPGQFEFSGCDFVANFTNTVLNGTYFGTTVIWGIALPSWIQRGNFNKSALTAYMVEHITGIMRHYNSGPLKMESMVIVNEAASNKLHPGAPEDGMFKHNLYYPTIPDYVEIAFRAAHAAAPGVKLFYNDYGWATGDRFDVVHAMMAGFAARGVPVDGAGLQMHCDVGSWGGDSGSFARELSANIARIGALGLEFRITEMDVTCGGYSHPCDDVLFAQQAQVYGDVLEACLNNTACTGFETWGFTDLHTWMGTGKRPLPFDVNYDPKPAYWELLATLQHHPRTRAPA